MSRMVWPGLGSRRRSVAGMISVFWKSFPSPICWSHQGAMRSQISRVSATVGFSAMNLGLTEIRGVTETGRQRSAYGRKPVLSCLGLFRIDAFAVYGTILSVPDGRDQIQIRGRHSLNQPDAADGLAKRFRGAFEQRVGEIRIIGERMLPVPQHQLNQNLVISSDFSATDLPIRRHSGTRGYISVFTSALPVFHN